MDTVHLKAPAKINLTLDITGVRDDGYHTMKMIMQSVDLCDLVRIEKTAQGGIRIECSNPTLPTGEENIAYRAAAAFFDAVGQSERNILIRLEKRIPHEAGLAGGSADAAVEALLAGTLDYNPDIQCSHHAGHAHGECESHGCGEHHCG